MHVTLVSFLGLLVAQTAAGAVYKRGSISDHSNLAGRSDEEIELYIRDLGPKAVGGLPPTQPIKDVASKLVNDRAHPWKAPRDDDVRGPCPGMNTLASHGYMSRTGVDSPGNMVDAVQLGFNMGWDIATFITYASLLVEGNPITNLLSIGRHSDMTGTNPKFGYSPNPEGFPLAMTMGIAKHGPFEGDTSQARADYYWGDNVAFNETVFQTYIDTCNKYGNGTFNLESAKRLRAIRYDQSRAANPTFTFDVPRYATAYAETTFPLGFFVDGRKKEVALDLVSARSFYQFSRMPEGFYRRNGSWGVKEVGEVVTALKSFRKLEAGKNYGLGTFVKAYAEVQELLDADGNCAMYNYFVGKTMEIYPNPKGLLQQSLKQNLRNMFLPLSLTGTTCTELFPYGH